MNHVKKAPPYTHKKTIYLHCLSLGAETKEKMKTRKMQQMISSRYEMKR